MTIHPEVQRKLRAHIQERIPDIQERVPTFEELNATNTPYLEAVVHESLRMSRTAGGYAREGESAYTDSVLMCSKGRRHYPRKMHS